MPYTTGSPVIAQDAEQLPPMGHLAMVALRPRVGSCFFRGLVRFWQICDKSQSWHMIPTYTNIYQHMHNYT